MKTTSTLKSLLAASILVASGAISSFAQSNGALVNPITNTESTSRKTYTIFFEERVLESQYEIISATASNPQITLGTLNKINGRYFVDLSLIGDLPLGASVTIEGDGKPLWHVTVADILGSTESEPNYDAARPVDVSDIGHPTGDNPTQVSQPSMPQTVVSGSASGVNKNQPKIDLYPNPANGFILIVTEGEVLWGVTEIIDLTGKKILEIPTGSSSPANGSDRVNLNVEQLKPGTYFVRFKTNKDVYTKRFQIAR